MKQAESNWQTSDNYDEITGVHLEVNLNTAYEELMVADQCIKNGKECSVDLGFAKFIIENEERFFEK